MEKYSEMLQEMYDKIVKDMHDNDKTVKDMKIETERMKSVIQRMRSIPLYSGLNFREAYCCIVDFNSGYLSGFLNFIPSFIGTAQKREETENEN